MKKNQPNQKWRIYAEWENRVPFTGGAAVITATLSKDHAAAEGTNDENPTEDETEKGYYDFALTQAETNADVVTLIPVCSVWGVRVWAVPEVEYPETVTVASVNYTISNVDIDPPAALNLTTGYLLCLGTTGISEAGVVIQAKLHQGPGTAGYALDTGLITMTSAANGIAQHTGFVRGSYYRFRRGTGPWTVEELAPDAPEWPLPAMLGQA